MEVVVMVSRRGYALEWRRTLQLVGAACLILQAGISQAQQSLDSGKCVVVELFTRDKCPRCVEAAL
jgi:hypothetical protein